MADRLNDKLESIEQKLGSSEKMPAGVVDGLDWHLTKIEELLEGGGGGGTTVVANPELVGDEDDLQGLQVGSTKYKIPAGGEGGIGLDSVDNIIGLAYDTSFVSISAGDGRRFETLSDYADFLNLYDGKEFLVTVDDPDTGKYNTETAIMWANYNDNNNTEYVTLETAHGIIDISITEEDSEVVFNVDWSQAVNWAATEGGGGGGGDTPIDDTWAAELSNIVEADISPVANIFATSAFDPQETHTPEELNAHYLCPDNYVEFDVALDPVCGTPENIYITPSTVTHIDEDPIPEEWKLRDYTITPANGTYKIRIRLFGENEMPEDVEYPGPQVVNIWIACVPNL